MRCADDTNRWHGVVSEEERGFFAQNGSGEESLFRVAAHFPPGIKQDTRLLLGGIRIVELSEIGAGFGFDLSP